MRIPVPRLLEVEVDIFVATDFEGDALELEGALAWYDREALPFARMWADQRYWVAAVLDGFTVDGTVAYGPDDLQLSKCEIRLRLPTQS